MPEYEWAASTVGPSIKASVRRANSQSSSSVRRGFCTEATFSPRACRYGITSDQYDPGVLALLAGGSKGCLTCGNTSLQLSPVMRCQTIFVSKVCPRRVHGDGHQRAAIGATITIVLVAELLDELAHAIPDLHDAACRGHPEVFDVADRHDTQAI